MEMNQEPMTVSKKAEVKRHSFAAELLDEIALDFTKAVTGENLPMITPNQFEYIRSHNQVLFSSQYIPQIGYNINFRNRMFICSIGWVEYLYR